MTMDANTVQQFKSTPMYKHLTAVISAIQKEHNKSTAIRLEDIALYSKRLISESQKLQFRTPEKQVPPLPWVELELLNRPKPKGEDEEEEEVQDTADIEMSDVWSMVTELKRCGVQPLSESEILQYIYGVKLLQKKHSTAIQKCRFWGTIFAIQRNYIVTEVEFTSEFLESNEGRTNPGYFVTTNDSFIEWNELPELKLEWLDCARGIKKYFTGDINAPVSSHPPFPGYERQYLRTQIARISSVLKQVSVLPKKRSEEDEEEEEEAEEEDEAAQKRRLALEEPNTWCEPRTAGSQHTYRRNPSWRGAVVSFARGQVLSMYCGYGVENGKAYAPSFPTRVYSEFESEVQLQLDGTAEEEAQYAIPKPVVQESNEEAEEEEADE